MVRSSCCACCAWSMKSLMDACRRATPSSSTKDLRCRGVSSLSAEGESFCIDGSRVQSSKSPRASSSASFCSSSSFTDFCLVRDFSYTRYCLLTVKSFRHLRSPAPHASSKDFRVSNWPLITVRRYTVCAQRTEARSIRPRVCESSSFASLHMGPAIERLCLDSAIHVVN